MLKTQFTDDQLAEIYFALGDRVNQLIKSKNTDGNSAQFDRLVHRQLERTNEALAIVEKIIAS